MRKDKVLLLRWARFELEAEYALLFIMVGIERV